MFIFQTTGPPPITTCLWESATSTGKNAVNSQKTIGYDDTITREVFCDDPTMLFHYLDLSRRLVLDLWNG